MIEVRKGSPGEILTGRVMKVYRKYVGKLTWLASNTRLDLAVYVMESARNQKNATLKDLRNINRILEKVSDKKNVLVFGRVTNKDDMCVIGMSNACYHQEESSVVG